MIFKDQFIMISITLTILKLSSYLKRPLLVLWDTRLAVEALPLNETAVVGTAFRVALLELRAFFV